MTQFDADPAVGAPEVDAQEASTMIEGGAFLLDVREPDEWEAGHAPAASHVPLGDLENRLDRIPLGETIVCVCRGGGRSARAAAALVGAGYDAWNLVGGMRAWAAAGLPVVDGGGASGSVI